MKRIAALALFAASLTLAAQQPPLPNQTPAQVEIQKQAELLQTQAQLLYEKLHGITEFQQYLQIQQQLNALQGRYSAASAHSTPQSHSAKTPAKPATPKM